MSISQNKIALEWLRRGKTLTHLTSLKGFDCARLAARIYELREAGHEIKTMRVATDNGKLIGSYRLIKEAGQE